VGFFRPRITRTLGKLVEFVGTLELAVEGFEVPTEFGGIGFVPLLLFGADLFE
jgi:hypothetical protein